MITAAHPGRCSTEGLLSRDSLLTDKAVLRGVPCLPSLSAVCVFLAPAFITQFSQTPSVMPKQSILTTVQNGQMN